MFTNSNSRHYLYTIAKPCFRTNYNRSRTYDRLAPYRSIDIIISMIPISDVNMGSQSNIITYYDFISTAYRLKSAYAHVVTYNQLCFFPFWRIYKQLNII